MQSQSIQQITKTAQGIINELNEESQIEIQTQLFDNDIRVFYVKFEQIKSTMLISEKWPRELLNKNTYFVFTAKSQTQGKGQTTNTWTSPPGNVYMTILGEFHANSIPLLSLTVALATSQMFRQHLNLNSGIKWVNDVFINDKKISGVLIKTQFGLVQNIFIAEIGIGINVKVAPIQTSTCLQKQKGQLLNVEEIIKKQVFYFFKTSSLFTNNALQVKKQFKKHLIYLGQNVFIYDATLQNILHEGIFEDITESGAAILKTSTGTVTVHDGRMRKLKL